MQLIGFSFTFVRRVNLHLLYPLTHFALCVPLFVLAGRRLIVSSEMRLLGDLLSIVRQPAERIPGDWSRGLCKQAFLKQAFRPPCFPPSGRAPS